MQFILVLQWSAASETDFDALVAMEAAFESDLDESHGFVDGHDFGSGEMNIFVHTDRPLEAFRDAESSLGADPRSVGVRAAYRAADRDEYTVMARDTAGVLGVVMRRLLLVFVSLIVGWVGFVRRLTRRLKHLAQHCTSTHFLDGQPMARDATHSAFERGPPLTSYDRNATSDVVDQSHGGSSRQSGLATRASYDYDLIALLAQIDNTTATVTHSARAISGDHSSIRRWQVAAKTVPEVVGPARSTDLVLDSSTTAAGRSAA